LKVIKLTGILIEPAVASATKFKNSDKVYYTLYNGSIGKDLWCYKIGLDYRYFKPENDSDVLKLTDNNYFLRPVYKDNEIVKDRLGNPMYALTIDHMDNHKNDVLLLWEIPNRYNYSNIKYKIDGIATELAIGYTGKVRSEVIYKTPSPIIEITGDVILSWTAEDDEHIYSQTIKYSYADSNWDISPTTIKDK